MKKLPRIGRLTPNPGLWNKPIEYYKEYMSYVKAFNDAIDEKTPKAVPTIPQVEVVTEQPIVETPKIEASSSLPQSGS